MANREPIFSFISMIIFTTFLISVNSQEVSFNFDRFTAGDSRITLQGRASINNRELRLIDPQDPLYNTGRALYSSPVRMRNFGNGASFVTSFSFVMQNIEGARQAADGIIFFLSPSPQIPTNSSGGMLGVVNPSDAFNNFVGVELDNFVDPWDSLRIPHIGINVNSLYSVNTVRWDYVRGSLVTVSIVYTSPLKTLSVTVTDEYAQLFTVSQVVDLNTVLPETVHIGLSATTSIARQLTDVRSWSFTSTFGSNNNLLPIIAE